MLTETKRIVNIKPGNRICNKLVIKQDKIIKKFK